MKVASLTATSYDESKAAELRLLFGSAKHKRNNSWRTKIGNSYAGSGL